MRVFSRGVALLVCLAVAGCKLPGRRAAEVTPQRPDQISDFHTLYSSHCAACHGAEGRQGAAISLSNPVYLAYAGENAIAQVTARGIPGSLMPAFARSEGGLLTDAQIGILAHGMVVRWGRPAALQGAIPPPYLSSATGDPQRGEMEYGQHCLRCHAGGVGSILDPAYLGLISDGGLRTIIVTGKAGQGMHDWRGYGGAPLNDGQIADLVAFLAEHRSQTPGGAHSGSTPSSVPDTRDKMKPTNGPAQEKVSN